MIDDPGGIADPTQRPPTDFNVVSNPRHPFVSGSHQRTGEDDNFTVRDPSALSSTSRVAVVFASSTTEAVSSEPADRDAFAILAASDRRLTGDGASLEGRTACALPAGNGANFPAAAQSVFVAFAGAGLNASATGVATTADTARTHAIPAAAHARPTLRRPRICTKTSWDHGARASMTSNLLGFMKLPNWPLVKMFSYDMFRPRRFAVIA